ncbi:beta-mannosidase [Rhodococcus aetherivorans]|uniref:beta-mannosidase n=1 Tax=Rhodococcus aetherivorans TaxID=191292 RepID=UPI001639D6AA|nr:beta-mannosidase [Rhodococcus aetherivorans]MBC2592224.1 beta-mannosidase [Rhodococcus aetherivorans]
MGSGSTAKAWAVGLSIVAAATIGTAGTAAADPDPGARVTADGTALRLDGQPWWPTGFNAYQLGTNWAVNWGCGAMVDLDAYFGALPPHSLTRFNAFQALAVDRFTGELDFGPLDAVFAAAEAHGQLVIPVLAAQDGACEDEAFKDRQWYVDGWTEPVDHERAVLSFRDWVTTAVTRWKDSPALAAWELVGEPETSMCTDAACSWWLRQCPPDAAAVLRGLFDTAGAQVRAIDPRTLITAGLTGGGQCGTQGDEYALVGSSPFVDVVQYHDYGADGIPLPGDQWNGLARRIAQAQQIDKPLLVAEIGEPAGWCGATADRAEHIATKIEGQKAAGTAGALIWAFVPDPRPDSCTYDVGPDDELWDVIEEFGTSGASVGPIPNTG